MKKNRLIVDPDYDFGLLGIISNAKGYRMAWEVNQALNIELNKVDDLILKFINEDSLTILNYEYKTENAKLLLLKNKSLFPENITQYLIPELQKFDFLLWIKGADSFKIDEVIIKLKDSKIIQYIVEVDHENLKSRDNLLF